MKGTSQLVVDESRRVIVGYAHRARGQRDVAGRTCDRGRGAARRLWHAVPSFLTVSEVWLRLLEAYGL
jgi:dihydrolipoamide dehydrogenase